MNFELGLPFIYFKCVAKPAFLCAELSSRSMIWIFNETGLGPSYNPPLAGFNLSAVIAMLWLYLFVNMNSF